jgi:hypothetical protein
MGASQSSQGSKKLEEPIHHANSADDEAPYPTPTGQEYDVIDKIASELPNVIDDESRQQVEDYRQACDNGKGPMVRAMLAAVTCVHYPLRLILQGCMLHIYCAVMMLVLYSLPFGIYPQNTRILYSHSHPGCMFCYSRVPVPV